jgi:hypothetical protein
LRPPAAQGAVKLDDAEELVALRLGQAELGVKQLLLVVEDFE